MTTLSTHQLVTAAGTDLETALANKLDVADFIGSLGSGSLVLPNGDIIKIGTIASTASIGANGTLQVTVTFAAAFPNNCLYFNAVLTPAVSTDFYGLTSLVSLTKTAAVFIVKNGATAQAVASGKFFALGN
jgi:hypothetical protein